MIGSINAGYGHAGGEGTARALLSINPEAAARRPLMHEIHPLCPLGLVPTPAGTIIWCQNTAAGAWSSACLSRASSIFAFSLSETSISALKICWMFASTQPVKLRCMEVLTAS